MEPRPHGAARKAGRENANGEENNRGAWGVVCRARADLSFPKATAAFHLPRSLIRKNPVPIAAAEFLRIQPLVSLSLPRNSAVQGASRGVSPPERRRNVATGGARRNPWLALASCCRPGGQRVNDFRSATWRFCPLSPGSTGGEGATNDAAKNRSRRCPEGRRRLCACELSQILMPALFLRPSGTGLSMGPEPRVALRSTRGYIPALPLWGTFLQESGKNSKLRSLIAPVEHQNCENYGLFFSLPYRNGAGTF